MDVSSLFLLWLLAGIVNACFCMSIAESKGFNGISWAAGGFFFGPIALLAAVGLPDIKQRRYLRLLLEHKGISLEGSHGEPSDSSLPRFPENPNNNLNINAKNVDPKEDYKTVVRLYQENGGASDVDYKETYITARLILLKNKNGKDLAQFFCREGEWSLEKLYK